MTCARGRRLPLGTVEPPTVRAALAAAAAALLALPGALGAQDGGLSADGWGGIAVTTGDLVPFHNTGPSFGAGLTYRWSPRLGARLTGVGQFLLEPSPGARGGDRRSTLTLGSLHAGIEAELTDPRDEDAWRILVAAGAGATRLEVGESEAREAFAHTNPSGHLSVRIARDVGVRWDLFARWAAFVELGDTGDPDDHLGKEVIFPLGAGARFTP